VRPSEKLGTIHKAYRGCAKGKFFWKKYVNPPAEPALGRSLEPPSNVEPATRILRREQATIKQGGTVSPSQVVSNFSPRSDSERVQSVLVKIRRTGCSLPCSPASTLRLMQSFRPECLLPRHRFC
jgi:hypothetical protein